MRARRWFHGALFTVMVVLFVAGWVLRAHGRAMFAEIRATMAADRGRREAAPVGPGAPGLRAQWRIACGEAMYDPYVSTSDQRLLAGMPGPLTPTLRKVAADAAPFCRGIHRLVVQGPFLGLPDDPEPGAPPVEDDPNAESDDGRPLADELDGALYDLQVAAVCADDPRPVLADVDAAVECLRPPNSLAMCATMLDLARRRDEVYLALATRGQLPDDIRERWAAEPDHRREVATALACERTYWVPARAAWAAEAGPWEYWRWEGARSDQGVPSQALADWWGVAEHMRGERARIAAAEDALAGRAGADAPEAGDRSWLGSDHAGVEDELSDVVRTATQHRMAVLAAGLAMAWHDSGRLPEDGRGLDLAGGPERVALAYERLNPHRFVIHIATPALGPAYGGGFAPSYWPKVDDLVIFERFDEAHILLDLVPHTRTRGQHWRMW